MYRIKTLNKISTAGLNLLDQTRFQVGSDVENEDGILVRSADMHEYPCPDSLRAIARAGAGTNNIPIDRCSESGIVVFNTPGANANAVKELVRAHPEMTALFVTNYEMTLGAILAANELHIRIPEQLSLIGFDNMELAQVISPQLSIVTQPLAEIGRCAAELMLGRLEAENTAPQTVVLSTRLLEGQSVQPFAQKKEE